MVPRDRVYYEKEKGVNRRGRVYSEMDMVVLMKEKP